MEYIASKPIREVKLSMPMACHEISDKLIVQPLPSSKFPTNRRAVASGNIVQGLSRQQVSINSGWWSFLKKKQIASAIQI